MLSFDLSAPWRDMPFVALDVETTGFEPETCRVTEVGLVRFERGQIAERWGSLVDPGIPIPAKVSEITGITDDMVKGKPTFRELKWDVYGRIRDRIFVAYNADFDRRFLEMELKRAGLSLPMVPILDPLVWARALMPTERSHKLGRVCKKLGIDLENAHRAEDDAEACGKVLLRFADKVPSALAALLDQQTSWKDVQEANFAARRAEREARRIAEGKPAQAPPPEPEPEPEKNQAGLFG